MLVLMLQEELAREMEIEVDFAASFNRLCRVSKFIVILYYILSDLDLFYEIY